MKGSHTQSHHRDLPPADDKRFFWVVAGITLLLTLLPYLLGARYAHGRQFTWISSNLVGDSTVYLAQMRQAADGTILGTDLFTTEPQTPALINPFFLLLGSLSRFTGLSLLAVHQMARLGFGLGLLLLVWKFTAETLADGTARRFAFLFVCFGAGFGWLPGWWESHAMTTPVDSWMAEGFTLLSLYLSPLFCVSLLLQVAIFHLLLRADRTGRISLAVGAGGCGFLLTLIHPYNIVSEAIVWGAYLALNLLRPPGRLLPAARERTVCLRNGLTAGLMTLPALLYMMRRLAADETFRQTRPQEPSVSLVYVALGYGIPLLLALLGAGVVLFRRAKPAAEDAPAPPTATTGRDASRLLVVWAVLNVACAYLPVAFQRRMIQGAHFPIALLAGIGAAWLLARGGKKFTLTCYAVGAAALLYLSFAWESGTGAQLVAIGGFWLLYTGEVKAATPNALRAGAALAFACSLTFLYYLRSDTVTFRDTSVSYLAAGQADALRWIRDHAPTGAIVQPIAHIQPKPDNPAVADLDDKLARFVPEMTGRSVYYGHEAETIRYGDKMNAVLFSCSSQCDDAKRRALWRGMGIRYLIFSQKDYEDLAADHFFPLFRGRTPLPPYLKRVFSSPDADVYEIASGI